MHSDSHQAGTAFLSDLTSAPIPSLIRRLAVPAGTGFFFNTMFNVVNTWYGGKLSTTALAAMSLCFPVFFILLAIGSGVSTGATALIGHALGRGDRDEARQYILQAFSFALINALALVIGGLAGAPSIFHFMGAEGEYLVLATSYMNVIFCGAPFFLLNFVMNAMLSAHGDTATYRNFLIAGFFLNLLLAPLFMYGLFGLPPLGLPGVALATVVIQCIGNLFLFRHLSRTDTIGEFRPAEFLPRRHYFAELSRQGFPAMLNMMTVSLGIFIITWFAGRYGKDVVAAYGIASRLEQIALLPVMGLNVSTMALSAQNFGAGKIRRVRETLAISLRYGFTLAFCGTLVALFFTAPLMTAFTSDHEVIRAGVRFLKIEAFVFPAYVVLYICVSAMQGVKRPFFAIWIGLYRQILAPASVFHLLAVTLGWGVIGIWWGIFGVTWSAAIIVVAYTTFILKKLEKDSSVV